ncbi:MAG TPA: NAD(P)-binding domain-containing protein [Ktedonobacteraceae bacterium]
MSIVSNAKKEVQQSSSTVQYDAVVVGAGPYGLAVTTHLRGKRLRTAIFGKPLELWRENMPDGMCLRSHWWATHISDPERKYSFTRFFAQSSKYKACYPVPIEAFIEYGLWFQKNAVPDVDETYVSRIERRNNQFVLTLEDGRVVQAPIVVMALGLFYFAYWPEEYSHLPAELISHSNTCHDFRHLAGKDVAVIGGGQSAVEYSALMHEAGVKVHLVSRNSIVWLEPDNENPRSLLERIKEPTSGIANGWRNRALEVFPYLFYRFSQSRKDRFLRSHYLAAASDWLRNRVIGKVDLHEKKTITSSRAVDGKVELKLSSGEVLKVDHVMLATGYSVKVRNLPMLDPDLASQIKTYDEIPILNSYFESSVPGMYFVGLSTVRAFGPLYRFVLGNTATVRRVASAAAKLASRAR